MREYECPKCYSDEKKYKCPNGCDLRDVKTCRYCDEMYIIDKEPAYGNYCSTLCADCYKQNGGPLYK